jgi:cytochrome o ubiquinol oxidase subunit 1
VLAAGLASLFVQLYVSIRDRDANRVPVGDPWDARGLEWSIAAPPPEWNFATIPQVGSRDPFYWRKRNDGAYKPADHYRDIALPKESACGVIIGLAAAACGFGLVWRIWWMAALFLTVGITTAIARSFMRDVTRIIPAATVEAVDRRWLAQAHAARPVPRELEQSGRNEGLAEWMA